MSPTLTSPAMMTGVGALLGTAAYMAPEQAKGRPAEKRSDIWAFGCVLFEMLTGKRPFDGGDIAEVLGAVVRLEPEWSKLPGDVPESVRALLRSCLVKDLRTRVSDISTVLFVLRSSAVSAPNSDKSHARRGRRLAVIAAAAVVVTAIASASITWLARRPGAVVRPLASRLQMVSTGAAEFTISNGDRDLAITPDGSRIIYIGNRGSQLFVRALDALEPIAVFTGAPRGPFVSPDGQWIGFFDRGNTLKKVAVTGGPAITLATLDGASRGGTWAPDDTIIAATNNQASGLQKVPASGGMPTALTNPAETSAGVDHLWPEMLPGGRFVLFTLTSLGLTGGPVDSGHVAALDLQSGKTTVVVRGGSHAQYAATGHLVYANGGALLAIPFDPVTLTTRGTAVPVIPNVIMTTSAGVDATIARDGPLVYAAGRPTADAAPRSLVWVDRRGREEPSGAPGRAYGLARISPDGTHAVVDVREGTNDIWTWDFARSTLTRLTFDAGQDDNPAWTPDGRRIVFRSVRSGTPDIFWTLADGTGMPERLPIGKIKAIGNGAYPRAVVPDGRSIIIAEITSKGDQDLIQVVLGNPPTSRPLVSTPANETGADVSPDGHWLVYESDESGRDEIYVRPFPEVTAGRWQVSTDGGRAPMWARNGRELFYTDPRGSLVSVAVQTSPTFTAGKPTVLFADNHYVAAGPRAYDVSPDGQRFLRVKEITAGEEAAAPVSVVVVQNWFEELKRLVPTN